MALDNPIGGGKSEAGSLPNRLGCIKRIKAFLNGLFAHAFTIIGNRHQNSPALLLGLYDELPAGRHCITGVGAKVHQSLADAGSISHNRQMIRVFSENFNFFVKRFSNNLKGLADHLGQVDYFKFFLDLFAGKLKQSVNQTGAPSYRCVDATGNFVQTGLVFIVHLYQLAVNQYFGQGVSEVVGHPGGNRTDGLHFLNMLQLHLQTLALGHIGNHDDDR